MTITLTSGLRGGDVIKSEGDPIVTRESKTIVNASGSTIELEAGYPMDDIVPVVQGTEANTDGLLIQPCQIAAGKSLKVAVLARGPAAINSDALPILDHAGATFTMATIISTVEALGIVVRDEPATEEVQTT